MKKKQGRRSPVRKMLDAALAEVAAKNIELQQHAKVVLDLHKQIEHMRSVRGLIDGELSKLWEDRDHWREIAKELALRVRVTKIVERPKKKTRSKARSRRSKR